MLLELTDDGLEIPSEYQDTQNVVIRTPDVTIESSTFNVMVQDGVFPLITTESFSELDESNLRNEELYPDQVSLKKQGDDQEVFTVDME